MLISSELIIAQSKIDELIRNNPDLIWCDIQNLKEFIKLVRDQYMMDGRGILEILQRADLKRVDANDIKKKYLIIHQFMGITAKQYGFALRNNPVVITMSEENLKKYLEKIKEYSGRSNQFIRNMLIKTVSFARRSGEEDAINIKHKVDLLKSFGFTDAQIDDSPGILGNGLYSIDSKVKLAMIVGDNLEEFITSHYMASESKIYARLMAIDNKITSITTPYVSEKYWDAKHSTKELLQMFQLNKEHIDKLFEQKYPELALNVKEQLKISDENISKELAAYLERKTAVENTIVEGVESKEKTEETTTIAPVKEKVESTVVQIPAMHKAPMEEETQPAQSESSSNEPREEYDIKRVKRILGLDDFGYEVLMAGLGNPEFNEVLMNRVSLNMVNMNEMGYSKAELIAHPKVLVMNPESLELRAKLAKINGRTNAQFLASDFRFSEKTIYPRTVGTKIMVRASKTKDVPIYDTERRFQLGFGASTEELMRYCDITKGGKEIIESLYQKITTETQDEK